MLISAGMKCVRSEDDYFFPGYAGEASAGILCFSFGHRILKPVDKLKRVQGVAVGVTGDLETYEECARNWICKCRKEIRNWRHDRSA